VICYLDTSAWVAWKFAQKGQEVFAKVSLPKDTVISSPLLASEYIACLKRENRLNITRIEDELEFIHWVYPTEPLYASSLRCVREATLRGADLFHLATAYWFAEGMTKELHFLSCDTDQRRAASKLGFEVP